jgi:hypothetical protein
VGTPVSQILSKAGRRNNPSEVSRPHVGVITDSAQSE